MRLAAVGVHDRDGLVLFVLEDDEGAIGREAGVMGVVTELLDRASDDRDDVNALLFLRDRAAD
jgi:hypothetical protein